MIIVNVYFNQIVVIIIMKIIHILLNILILINISHLIRKKLLILNSFNIFINKKINKKILYMKLDKILLKINIIMIGIINK